MPRSKHGARLPVLEGSSPLLDALLSNASSLQRVGYRASSSSSWCWLLQRGSWEQPYQPLARLSTTPLIFFGDGTNRVANEYITIVQEPGDKRTAINDGGSLSAGTWYNIVFNYESSQYNIYINNTLKLVL